MQEINSPLSRLAISPRGWGIFCLLLENVVPYCGAFVCFGTIFKANPHLYPGVGGGGGGGGGVGVYFDWCIKEWRNPLRIVK